MIRRRRKVPLRDFVLQARNGEMVIARRKQFPPRGYWHNILRRDPCAYCGRRSRRLTLDHVEPQGKRGTNALANLTAACWSCNQRKGHTPLLLHLLARRAEA